MSLGDPFSTTYEGSFKAGQSLGAGIESAAGSFADVMKRKQSFEMLKKFGLIKEETTPPSIDELKSGLQQAGKTYGKNINFNISPTADEEQTKRFLTHIYTSLSIPMPQGKNKTTITPGVTMDLGGGTSYTAQKQEKTTAETVAEYKALNESLKDTSGQATVSSRSGITIKPKTGTSDILASSGLDADTINSTTPEERQSILKDKNPSYYNRLEMLKDGKMLTQGRTSKELQQMYGDAGELWPGEVDAVKGIERNKMAQNIAGGDVFKSAMRGNTLVGHIDTLFKKMEELKNMQLRLGNAAKNTVAWQTGVKEIQQARQAGLAVANEMEGYLRNSNIMSELGIQENLENIPIDGSPEQQQGWIETTGDLFMQRRNAVNDIVKSIMGSKYKFDLLSDRSKNTLRNHGINVNEGDYPSESSGQGVLNVAGMGGQQSPPMSMPNQGQVDYKSKYGLQ